VRRVFVDGPPRARRVHFIPCTERVEVLGAPDLLRAAFEAVHDRAQRETPDGGEVEVATALVDENGARFAEIRVTDGGAAPAPARLAHVFDPFPDADQVAPGSGIEMAAAAGIVRNHGGSAEARPGVRAGTAVILRLPVYGRSGPARSAAEARA
jgi:signal transduction histidine kinase